MRRNDSLADGESFVTSDALLIETHEGAAELGRPEALQTRGPVSPSLLERLLKGGSGAAEKQSRRRLGRPEGLDHPARDAVVVLVPQRPRDLEETAAGNG